MEFLCDNYIKITETCFHETKTAKRITKCNETHCDTEALVYVVASQSHRCQQHRELESRALETRFTANTEFPKPELPDAFPQRFFRLTPGNTGLPRVGFFVSLTATCVTRCYSVAIETRLLCYTH